MSEYTVRFAVSADAETFAKWAADNPDIPLTDIEAATKEVNPTSTTLVIERNGKVVMYLPAFCALTIAFLGFNPDASTEEKLGAMEAMLSALSAFAQAHGIREINTLTVDKLPVARWARKHGFESESRKLYRLQLKNGQR